MTADYTPPVAGSEVDGMFWSGEAWTPICPDDQTVMAVDDAEFRCETCGRTFVEIARAGR